MSRGFFGGMGGGGGDGNGRKPGMKASDMLKKQLLQKKNGGGGGSRYAEKPNYSDVMKQRIEEYKQQMIKEASNRGSFSLPGADMENVGLSENAKKMLEQMAEKKALKDARKKKMKELADQQMAKKIKGKDGPQKKPLNFGGMGTGTPQPGAPAGGGRTQDSGSWSGTMWGKKDPWEGTMWGKKDDKKDW
jgi:hypothetical protein